jgi:methyl-accepting chemotaxis protein
MSVKNPFNIWINTSFQLRFIGYFSAAIMLKLAFFYLAKRYYFDLLFEEGISLGLAHTHTYFKLLLRQEILLEKIFFVTTSITFTFLFIFSLFLSNRIAKPLYNLNDYFIKLSHGEDSGEIKYGKNDFFRDLPQNYNAFRDLILKNQKEHKEIIHPKEPS